MLQWGCWMGGGFYKGAVEMPPPHRDRSLAQLQLHSLSAAGLLAGCPSSSCVMDRTNAPHAQPVPGRCSGTCNGAASFSPGPCLKPLGA